MCPDDEKDVWFDLQALSYLIESKEGKTPKKLKIATSCSKIKISKNKKKTFSVLIECIMWLNF